MTDKLQLDYGFMIIQAECLISLKLFQTQYVI